MSEYQTILAQLQACENQDERDRLSLNFSLSQLPEQMQAAVQAAAVPRFFDRAFLNALLEQPLDAEQFVELTGFSYIEPYPGKDRFNVHERTRKLLQEKLWQEDETLYREISRRAFAYCAKQDQDDTTWRIETVYHQLVAEPEEGAIELNDTCAVWMNPPYFANNKAESLLLAAREHMELKRLLEKAAQFFWLNQANVDIRYSRYHEAKEALRQMDVAVSKDDRHLLVNRLECLGDAHYFLSEVIEAQQCFEEALQLRKENGKSLQKANCLSSLGDVHRVLFNFKQARRYYDKSLQLSLHDQLTTANNLFGIGEVLLRLSKYKQSRSYFRRALKLYKKIGERIGEANCIRSLGEAHLACSEFPEAQQLVEEALQLYRKIDDQIGKANCFQAFGELFVKTGDFIAAKQYYEQALALAEHLPLPDDIAECWEGFAKLHQAQQQLPQAEECWRKAAEIYRNLAMPLREKHCLEQIKPQP
ncbi:tetratricopeptide repeat protein [Candidatus Electronema sp. PJ]|uniref:tetratricopeptide repeat protein n=1 Tax=Candidatus Electronema sp. PJ TaxID=3401572 RepID=UPI003AA7D221